MGPLFRTWTMGTMTFDLPARLPEDAQAALERASVAGGQDNMPYPTQVHFDHGRMILTRAVDESGCLVGSVDRQWRRPAHGFQRHPHGAARSLSIRSRIGAGKVNQIRGQVSDWLMGGLQMPAGLAEQIRQTTLGFSKAVTLSPDPRSARRRCKP